MDALPLILADQLSASLASLRDVDAKQDVILIASCEKMGAEKQKDIRQQTH